MITADLVNLASDTDVARVLQRDLTSSETSAAGAALAKASRLFRKESGQIFTPGTSFVRLRVNPGSKAVAAESTLWGSRYPISRAGAVYLRQRPVNMVTTVTDEHGNAVEHERFDQWIFIDGLGAGDFVRVTYSHGDEEVPDEVSQTVAEMVARSLPVPEDVRMGVSSRTEVTGPFTDTIQFAGWAVGGTVQMSPEEKLMAQSYRQRIPIVWVQRP